MRMMYIKGFWYHILEEIKTPFYKEDNFQPKFEYIILEREQIKYFRPDNWSTEEKVITQQQLAQMIAKIDSQTWRSEERRLSYATHYKKVMQIMRQHIINGVLTEVRENINPILWAC